ncbi:MAG: hypothetical protein NC218_01820 [Acetobacter sp.]|nr:hypothetical protein [Acetobacter sp.]
MLVVLLIIFLAIGVSCLCVNIYSRNDSDDGIWWARGVPAITSLVIAVGLFIAVMVMIPNIATAPTYDTRIEIVEETNKQVEDQVCAAVNAYLKHEEDTYRDMFGDATDAGTAIGIYLAIPTLKGDALVSTLIETYQTNAEEIKQLKLAKANLSLQKFLVYFGR